MFSKISAEVYERVSMRTSGIHMQKCEYVFVSAWKHKAKLSDNDDEIFYSTKVPRRTISLISFGEG